MFNLLAPVLTTPPVFGAIKFIAAHRPYRNIDGYMNRGWIFNPYDHGTYVKHIESLPSIRLHHILREDDDRHMHDHPWDARTFILAGWYVEARLNADGTRTLHRREAGYTGTLKFGEYHRIVEVSPGGVYTLFCTGKYQGTWGFLVDGQKIHHKAYLNADSPEAVSEYSRLESELGAPAARAIAFSIQNSTGCKEWPSGSHIQSKGENDHPSLAYPEFVAPSTMPDATPVEIDMSAFDSEVKFKPVFHTGGVVNYEAVVTREQIAEASKGLMQGQAYGRLSEGEAFITREQNAEVHALRVKAITEGKDPTNYGDWIEVGSDLAKLYLNDPDSGLRVWDAWSKQAANYAADAMVSRWDSLVTWHRRLAATKSVTVNIDHNGVGVIARKTADMHARRWMNPQYDGFEDGRRRGAVAAMAFEQGFRACAEWAKREDLVSDIDSPAYIADRAKRLNLDWPT